MLGTYKTPGVYLEQVFIQPEVRLPTGIPGFIGFADVISASLKAQSVVVINRKEEFFDKFNVSSAGYLKEAVIGFFDNGGTRCYVVRADSTNNSPENALKEAIKALAPLTDVDLVAIPDVMSLPDDAIIRVQQEVISHCTKQGNRFAILDALRKAESVSKQREGINKNITQEELRNGALYYPWLQNAQQKWVPPCGHIAGIFARSDRTRGVFKAPANEEIQDAVGLEVLIDNSEQDELNPLGINCLRAFPGRGIRVWGARTLSREPNWRYINVRRLFLTLQRWIDMNMSWVTFEPNSPQLWVGIERELSSYLTQLWRAGALKGETPGQAFYVKCNAETNPPENREVGKVLTEIGLAPTSPAEFIVVRITQRPNTTELNG